MSKNVVKDNTERISRLGRVKSGVGVGGPLKMPKRGRVAVDIDCIVPDPANERKTFIGIEELAASMDGNGILEPPTVVPIEGEGEKYMLTTGERRWRAAKLAGFERIHVIIGEPEDETKRRVKSLISNIQREDLTALELSSALRAMKVVNPKVKTNRDLATLIGKSEQWVGQVLKLNTLSDELQEQIQNAGQKVSHEAILQAARVEDESVQKELVQDAIAGASVQQIREKARAAKPERTRAGKATVKSTQKVPVSKGWVIIHCDKKNAKKEDYIAALTEALKTVRQEPKN